MWSKLVQPTYDSLSWDYWFGQVDVRPLGVFRIFFALILLKDAIYHLFLGEIFYSDTGIAPRDLMTAVYRDFRWSLMDYFGADWQVALFFVLWIIVLICLLLGYQTKLMTILNWVIIVSIHERNILMLSGADSVMRVMSFWILFLPLGRAYSLDRRFKPTLSKTAFAFPLRMVQLQFALIYLGTFMLKTHGIMWLDGSAVYHALQLRGFTHPIADWMLATAPYWMFQIASWFTLLAEGAFFVFMFLPFEQPRLKAFGLLMMGAVHVGISVLMAVPNFSMVMLACYFLFVDGAWLKWLGSKLLPQHNFKDIAPLSPIENISLRRWIVVLLTGSLLFTVYGYNLWFMRPNNKPLGLPISTFQIQVVQGLGIWQRWDMFSPNPFKTDGGLLVIGTFSDSDPIELRRGQSYPDDEIPRFYFGIDTRWKKYDEGLYYGSHTALMKAHAEYRCRTFNANNLENRLEQVELIYRSRQTYDVDTPENPYADESILIVECEG